MAKRKKIDKELDALMPLLIGMWRKSVKLSGPPEELQTREFRDFVSHVVKINDLEGVYGSSLQTKEMLWAYMLYFYPLRYQEALSLIGEIPVHGEKMLDISIAPSPFALAASKYGYTDVTVMGPSEEALQLAANTAGRMGYPIHIARRNLESLKLPSNTYDLITLTYSLFDLKQETLFTLLQALTKDGVLLLVESSIEEKNRRFLEMRDFLNEAGFQIQAPCIWQGKCPALAHKNMCFAQREVEKPYLVAEANRAGKINMNSLKMSYLIVRSKQSEPLEFKNKELYRIISPPFEDRGRKTYYLCGTSGRKRLTSSLKEQTNNTKAFDYLKRGEAIEILKAEKDGSTFVLDEESVMRVIAPLSKPLNLQEIDGNDS